MDLVVPPLHARAPFPPLLAAAPSLLLFALFLLPHSRFLTAALLPLLIVIALHSSLAYTTGDPAADFGIASAAFQRCLIALDRFCWTTEGVQVFRRPGERGEKERRGWRRACWGAAENTLLQRGVARRWQVSSVPAAPALSRQAFVLYRSGRALFIYACFDALSAYMQRQPYFRRQIAFAELGFLSRQGAALCAGAASSIALVGLYDVICVLGVGGGVWEVAECPDLMGSPREANSLAGFWGKFWHQCFRRPFTTCTRAVLSSLHLPPSSLFGRLLGLLVPFGLSAAQHAFAIYCMYRRGTRTALFFLLQPVGILLERLVQRIVKTRSLRVLGYAWVASWLLATGPLFFDDLVQGGMWEVKPPFSATEWILERVKRWMK